MAAQDADEAGRAATATRARPRSYTARPPTAAADGGGERGAATEAAEARAERGDDGARAPRPTQANPLSEPAGRPRDRRSRSP